jgi:hypothetical protein
MTAQSAAKGMGGDCEREGGSRADPPTPHERTMQSVAPPLALDQCGRPTILATQGQGGRPHVSRHRHAPSPLIRPVGCQFDHPCHRAGNCWADDPRARAVIVPTVSMTIRSIVMADTRETKPATVSRLSESLPNGDPVRKPRGDDGAELPVGEILLTGSARFVPY